MSDGGTKAPYQAPALDKGLDIIEFLAEKTVPHGMLEIAAALGRSRNEIYRMLLALERRGYLKRLADDRFVLSNRLFDYGMRLPPRRNLHDAALVHMHELAEHLYQSCHLAVASDSDIVIIARVESPGFLGFAVRLGYRRPIVQSSSGRVLFAFLPEDEQRRWLATVAIDADAAERDTFIADCEFVAQRGHSIGPSSFVDAITDIAVPIFDGASQGVVAALTVPFVSGRSAKSSVEEAVAAASATARAISNDLQNG